MEEQFAIQDGKTLPHFLVGVFAWMFIGLVITAAVALVVPFTSIGRIFFLYPAMTFILFIAEIFMVMYISGLLRKHEVSSSKAKTAFIVYAILNGIMLSSIFLVYDIGLIYKAFLGTGITFGVMAIYGYVTKSDLSRISSFLVMALIGVIVISLTNYIGSYFGWYSGQLDLILAYVTLVIFLGLTAWDIQKLKAMYNVTSDGQMLETTSVVGALTLYLDFINLFLSILRISSRD